MTSVTFRVHPIFASVQNIVDFYFQKKRLRACKRRISSERWGIYDALSLTMKPLINPEPSRTHTDVLRVSSGLVGSNDNLQLHKFPGCRAMPRHVPWRIQVDRERDNRPTHKSFSSGAKSERQVGETNVAWKYLPRGQLQRRVASACFENLVKRGVIRET